ncbi:ATP-binding cassette domain-containing protein [Glutamicibacter sp. NPDC087344]|uniref:ATP-binding cassette domain-containing protein n=1 Tax=Glutamicibacter sp. NPDC087344 TaxID=3363994 RepID=UPI0037FCBAF1
MSRLMRNPMGFLATAYLGVLVLVVVLGPWIVPYDPNAVDLKLVLAAPGDGHLLGGDSAGRDVFSRLIVGTSVSLASAAVAVAVAAVLGVSSGLIAGYRLGWFDTLTNWLTSAILSLPAIVVLLAARAVLGPSIWIIMVVFGIVLAPSYHRIVHGAVRAVRNELYIDAARVAGLSDLRIVGRHILTAVRAPAILLTAGLFSVAIAIQASLDFLGVGDSTLPTWGGILSDGFANISRTSLLMIWPSIIIAVTCLALNLFGNAVRDELEQTGDSRAAKNVEWKRVQEPHSPLRHSEDISSNPVLSVADLSVAYRHALGWNTVVHGISLEIAPGEIHALIGESGSGKSQTAFSILGLLPEGGKVVSGDIRFAGLNLTQVDEKEYAKLRGQRIGYIPQEPMSNLDPTRTIGAQLLEPLQLVLKVNRGEATDRIMELLDRVGIPDPQRLFRLYPHQISGGMAQRVLIAGAVSLEPELIIADEPTTALDVTVQVEILNLLRELQTERGIAMLLVTHNFGVVADLANRVSVMREGTIVEQGTVTEVFAAPQHEYTRGLFDALLDDAPARGALAEWELA